MGTSTSLNSAALDIRRAKSFFKPRTLQHARMIEQHLAACFAPTRVQDPAGIQGVFRVKWSHSKSPTKMIATSPALPFSRVGLSSFFTVQFARRVGSLLFSLRTFQLPGIPGFVLFAAGK